MEYTLTELRAEVVAALAGGDETATWSNALVDAALRRALQAVDRLGPVYEATHTVTTAGAEQELSALPGLLEVTGLAWPWHEGIAFEESAVRWRTVGEATKVRLRSGVPAVGDALRVRYRKAHTLEGLDGASTTSLPAELRASLALGGACFAVQLRARQAIENPALPRETVAWLRAWAEALEHDFVAELVGRTRSQSDLIWEGVGL